MAGEGAETPRFAFQQSMIPRPKKGDAETSPKSVIADMRFISPGSSSSSSKCQHRGGLERSYSTSDGEFSDPDSVLDSTGTSREVGKQSGNSGPLESLPETHSLALEASKATVPAAGKTPTSARKSFKRGDGEPACRIPLFPAVNGLDSASATETTALFVLADRTSDSGRDQRGGGGASLSHSDSARSENNYEDRARASRPLPAPEVPAVADHQSSEWSSESASEHDGTVLPNSSGRRYTASECGSTRRRDHGSRPTFSAELSSTGAPLERGSERRSVGPGAAANFGYSGTPLRFFPGCDSLPYSPSPRVPKSSYTLTPSNSDVGIRHQHRFLSGPIMGSMIPKPPPSKWDDADKWIVSPGRKQSPKQAQHQKALQTLLSGRRHSIAGGQMVRSHHGIGSPDTYTTPPGQKPMSTQFEHAFVNAGKIEAPQKRSTSSKKRSKALSFTDLSRKGDPSRAAQKQDGVRKDANGQKGKVSVPPSTDTPTSALIADDKAQSSDVNERVSRPLDVDVDEERQRADTAESTVDTSSEDLKAHKVSRHHRSVSMTELAVVSVCLEQEPAHRRDMATQVTPIESPKLSACTTASPTRHNTPANGSIRAYSLGAAPAAVDSLELQIRHIEKLELRSVAADGLQSSLDRSNIWTTREEEEMESAASLREDPDELQRFQLAVKATSWEEAAQSKALVRFKNKEAKIKAWEEQQRAQAEADLKKIEAKVEKVLAGAAEKMQERLSATSKKAAEMTAAAELVRTQEAEKIAVRAELMRKAGLSLSPSKTTFKACFRVRRR